MRLKTLEIRRAYTFEDKNEGLRGTVLFEDNVKNEVKIQLSDDAAKKIVDLCAQGILEATNAVAVMMIKEIHG